MAYFDIEKWLKKIEDMTLIEVHYETKKNKWEDYDSELVFEFDKGTQYFNAKGDCCSQSWIEHVDVPKLSRWTKVVGYYEVTMNDVSLYPDSKVYKEVPDHLQIYQSVFKTNDGDIIVEHRNDSNGYYGGDLELGKWVDRESIVL